MINSFGLVFGRKCRSRLLSMVFVVMHVQANFLSGSQGFYKNIDKFGWVKY